MQIKQHVTQQLHHARANGEDVPEVIITGQNYEVQGRNKLLASLISYLNMASMALLFAGDYIFSMIGGIHNMPVVVKDCYGWISENKMYFGFMTFFLSNVITANLLQSGAFEIHINGNLEYSKLKEGEMPNW